MKTKLYIFIAACAVLTLSFTFTSIKKSEGKVSQHTTSNDSGTAGGFAAEDKF